MKITLATAIFINNNLFGDYRNKLYLHMRKNKYSLENVLHFIDGYTTIVELCGSYLLDIEMGDSGFDAISNINSVLFNNKSEMLEAFKTAIKPIYKSSCEYSEWQIIGMKYAICLAKYYIIHVLYGDDTEVEEDLYIDIPDNDKPNSFDWKARGWDFDIEEIGGAYYDILLEDKSRGRYLC